MVARLEPTPEGDFEFYSPYSPGLVADLKATLPYNDRRWDPTKKAWVVSSKHGKRLAEMVLQHLGVSIDVPYIAKNHAATTQLLKLEYLGAAKDRGNGEPSAFGYVSGAWSTIFPLSVLRNWFEPGEEARPDEMPTLYAVLGVARDAPGTGVKKAYRRAARTWHPDVCKESDAATQFRRIKEAYEILSNPAKRARYDAGLKLMASLKHNELPHTHKKHAHWKPPLRCGYILAEGHHEVGRFVVSRILQWEDILDVKGQVMVSYWPAGADHFEVKWL